MRERERRDSVQVFREIKLFVVSFVDFRKFEYFLRNEVEFSGV